MTIEDSPTVAKLIDEYEGYEDEGTEGHGTPGKQGKKKGKSIGKKIKSTERFQVEKRQYNNRNDLYNKLKPMFAEGNYKQPYHRGMALRTYAQWIESLIGKNKVIDVEEEMKRNIDATSNTSSGPGGQNVNKLATKVRLYHTPTNTTTESEIERSQPQNLKAAKEKLSKKLQEHLDLWLASFPLSDPNTPKEITPEFIEKFISEPPKPPTTK